MTSKFDSFKSKVAKVTMSIAGLHSSLNHITILSLFKTDYYFYLFIYLHISVFCVFLFICLFTFFSDSIKQKVMHFCVYISGASGD